MREERQYTVEMEAEGGGEETVEITVPPGEADEQDEEAKKQAVQLVEDWIREGDWGDEGASVLAWYTLYDDEDEERTFPRTRVTVEVPANEEVLMRRAGAEPDCEHEFTSEGEGGCDENPGVWALGGTTFRHRSHCKHCGLIRTRGSVGRQRNPGEHDTVIFELPEE